MWSSESFLFKLQASPVILHLDSHVQPRFEAANNLRCAQAVSLQMYFIYKTFFYEAQEY